MTSPSPAATANDPLDELIAAARVAWPDVSVPEADVAALVREHTSGADARPLSQPLVSSLWLAVGCARGDAKALRDFEAYTFPGARSVLGKMGLPMAEIDEVLQILREKLLVAEPGEAPGILAAAAHGDLPGIVRVAAARTALNLRRKDHRIDLDDERLLTELCPDADPELATLKEQHRAAFKAAVEDALANLTPQERNVLRMHLLHGLSIDAIGSSFRVHRATAARWLGSIRAKLDRETRRLLRERKGLTDPEFDSLVRLVESRIQVSFRRVLGSAVGG